MSVSNVFEKLAIGNPTEGDIKNFIASHVQAAFTFYENQSGIEEEDEDERKKASDNNLTESLKNLEKSDKFKKEKFQKYYERILKSQILYYCLDKTFYEAETEFLPSLYKIKTDLSILQKSVQSVYLFLLSNYLNSIGSEQFISCESNKETISKTLETLNLDAKNSDIKAQLQRLLTRNGFIAPYSSDDSKKIINDFAIRNRFNFSEFKGIYKILTGKDCNNFAESIKALLESTNDTPLVFLNRFYDNQSEVYKFIAEKKHRSFISSPPHAYEKLVIDKLAICYTITDSLNQYQYDEEEEEEEADENGGVKRKEPKYYLQLLAADLRLRKPPEKRPDVKFFKLLKIGEAKNNMPADQNIRGSCYDPFYYDLGETNKDDDIKNELICKDWQGKLSKSFYTDIIDGLHPIESQLIRILEFSALDTIPKRDYKELYEGLLEKNPKAKDQINISRSLISSMLFPETRVGLAQDSVDLFILSCFSELSKLLESAKVTDLSKNLQNYLVAGRVRRVFQLAMDGIIPAVSQNIVKLANWTQSKVPKNNDEYEEPETDKNHSIYPFSGHLFLREFLLNPTLRRTCPVIYAFLRLQSRFCLTKRIPIISDMLIRIWDVYSSMVPDNEEEEESKENENEEDENDGDDGKTFKDLEITDEELIPFLNCWNDALDFVDNGPLSVKAREKLQKSREEAQKASESAEEEDQNDEDKEYKIASKVSIRPFLPYEPSVWPGLIVLETLSRAHNEFISILQQHSKILVFDVNDIEFLDSQVIDITVIGQIFSRAIRGKLGPDCLPIFNEEVEKEFIQQSALLPYHLILHPIINFAAKEDITMNSKGLIQFYEEHFNTIDLTEEQKKMLNKYIKECNKTAGALLLLSKYMFAAVSKGNTFKSTDNLSTFIENEKIEKTPLEDESYSALLIAKGKLREDFKIGQFSKMYAFLSEPIDNCRKAYSLQEAIIENVISACQIKTVEIDNITIPNVKNYRPYFTVIPKVLGDILKNNKNPDDKLKLTPPTKLIEMWENYDEKKKLLIDKEEREALEEIKKLDKERGNNKMTTLISYFNDAKANYKW